MSKNSGMKNQEVSALHNIASAYKHSGNYNNAIQNLNDALSLSLELNNLKLIRSCYLELYENYNKLGDNANSKKNYDLFTVFDNKIKEQRIKNIESETQEKVAIAEAEKNQTQKELISRTEELRSAEDSLKAEEERNMRKQMQDQMQIDLLEKENQLKESAFREQQAKLKLSKTIRNFFIGGFVLIVLFLAFAFRQYTLIKKSHKKLAEQNAKILNQKEEIKEQSKQLEKLSIVASETDNAVLITDANGDFEWVNDAYTKIFGYTFDQLINERSKNIIGPNTQPEVEKIIKKAIKKKETISFEYQTDKRTGENIWVQATITPILDVNKNIKKLVAIDSEISELKKAEQEITRQKEQITDSILYAERIQQAVLPPDEFISDVLPDHFIFFKPRDIVSGDFYWMRKIKNFVVIVVADCTGHGVPGAFMSMLGITFLNDIIVKSRFDTADELLNRLRKRVKKALRQTGTDSEAKDGMDLSLCIIDMEFLQMQFSGAFNSLYLIRKKELIEFKADRQPIAIYIKEKDFTNHEAQLQKGDCIYMSSDGFEDQMGGPNGKKFLRRRFKELLIENSTYPMVKQKVILDQTLTSWQNPDDESEMKYKQVDDILVFGVRV